MAFSMKLIETLFSLEKAKQVAQGLLFEYDGINF